MKVFFCLRSTIAIVLLALTLLLLTQPAIAVRMDSIYAAEVSLPGGSSDMSGAFDAALSKVLVKVSGLESLGLPAARRSLVPDSGRLVQQYSRLADNRLRVEFDGPALARILDAAGQPVWGVERPLVAVWYAVDAGGGRREVISGEVEVGRSTGVSQTDALREALMQAAEDRGLPVIIPLVDAEDLAGVTFSDLWGDFREPVFAASRRYGAQAILIGRARSLSADDTRVRWTLATPSEQYSWTGSAVGGPAQAAGYLSRNLATFADASGSLRLMVSNVDNLDKLGQLSNYLRSLNVVQNAAVVRVQDDRIEIELVVRGDAGRLSRSLDSGALLARFSESEAAWSGTRRPDLYYRWSAGSKD
jgi:hypothetical protein